MRPRRRPLALAAAFALAAVATLAGAQDAPAGSGPAAEPAAVAEAPGTELQGTEVQGTFFEEIQVGLAEIEVVVTDRDGNRVTDLRREDFTLYEEGEPVEITHFLVVTPEAAAAADVAAAAPEPDAMAAEGGATEQPVLVAVFIDNQSLTVASRGRTLPALRERLSSGQWRGARFMVASQDRPGALKVHLPPTSDVAAAVAAMDAAAKGVPAGQLVATNRARLIRDLELAQDDAGVVPDEEQNPATLAYIESNAEGIYQEIQLQATQAYQQAKATAAALAELVEGVAGLPGRKVVLAVSGGLSLRPAEALMSAWRNRFEGSNREWSIAAPLDDLREETTDLLRRVSEHANSNQVTLYAIGATDVPSSGASVQRADTWTGLEATMETANLADSVRQLVAPTGGLALVDAGDPGRLLDELAEDLSAYYSLGYSSRYRGPGSREVKVEVNRPGLRVRHRESRRNRTTREAMVDRTRAGMLFGWRENPLQVELEVGSVTPGDRRGTEVLPLTVRLPMSSLVLVPQGELHEGRLMIYIGAVDEQGRSSPVSEVAVPIRVPNEKLIEALGQLATYRTRLELRAAARQTIVVSVRDDIGNLSSTVAVAHPPQTGSQTLGEASEAAIAPRPARGR